MPAPLKKRLQKFMAMPLDIYFLFYLMTFNSHAETGETETESGFVKVLHG